MYNADSGEVVCDRCGFLIGNINGDGNFYSLIRTMYCDECKEPVRRESHRLAQRAYRKRKKLEKKAEKTKLQLLTEENELLRNKIIQLREEGQNV